MGLVIKAEHRELPLFILLIFVLSEESYGLSKTSFALLCLALFHNVLFRMFIIIRRMRKNMCVLHADRCPRGFLVWRD